MRDRLDEQGKYFGITIPQTLQVGEVAKQFSAEKLSRPFTVETCKEDALGRSHKERFYAFIKTPDGDLAEKLIENGLARIHGASGKAVGLPRADSEWSKLEQLQVQAKTQKVDVADAKALTKVAKGQDAVVSALPFFLNPGVAKACAEVGANYFDLTEDVATTRAVRSVAKKAGTAFAPQCGLAPGFISIVANHLAQNGAQVDQEAAARLPLKGYSSAAVADK